MVLPSDAHTDDRERWITRLEGQAESAAGLGSPLYADLIGHVAEDARGGGPCWQVLAHFAHEPKSAALPLRFMAAVHRLVLRRQAPTLAMHYASVGGQAGVTGAWQAFLGVVEAHRDALVDLTALPCQTNEVGRSAALGPGLGWLAAGFPQPLHHYEIGTSAGLNLRWDHFRYGTADGRVTWGRPDSPVDLTGHWVDPPRGLPDAVEIGSRQGCDPAPLDPGSAADRETLTAAVWPDMTARHERLKGALGLAEHVPAQVERAPAGEWLADRLPMRGDGLAVVTHSVVWRYIPADEQEQIVALLQSEGARATATRPLAWLRLEPRPPASTYDGRAYPLLATTWPGGETVELGTAQAHGQDVHWSVGPPRP